MQDSQRTAAAASTRRLLHDEVDQRGSAVPCRADNDMRVSLAETECVAARETSAVPGAGGHVIILLCMEDEPCSSMLHRLQSTQLIVRKSSKSRAAVVQLRENQRHDE